MIIDSSILLAMSELAISSKEHAAITRVLEDLARHREAIPKLEDSLHAAVRRARSAEELLMALKFTADIVELGIDPEYSLRYGITSALGSISDQNLLSIALDSALSLAKKGVDPWALLHYSIPAISRSARSEKEFQEYLREVLQLCLDTRCKRQDYMNEATAAIIAVEGRSKIQSLRIFGELLRVLMEKGLEIESVLQSIISLSSASSDVRQLEVGLEIALDMVKNGRDPAGLLKFGFPRAIEAAASLSYKELDLIAQMARRLIARRIDPQDVLRYAIRALMKFVESAGDLEEGLLELESLVTELDQSGINAQATLFYGLRALGSTCRSMAQLTRSLQFGAMLAREGIDPCNNFKYGIAWALGEINQRQLEVALDMGGRLISHGIDPLIALQYGVPIFARVSGNLDEFERGMSLLERMMIAFEKHNIDSKPLFTSVFLPLARKARFFEEFEARLEKIERMLAGGRDYDCDDLRLGLEAAIAAPHLEFEEVLEHVMELAAKLRENGMDPWIAATYSMPRALAALRSTEELECTMKLAQVLIDRQMEPSDHLQYAVPVIARVLREGEFEVAIQLAIKLAENGVDPYEVLYYGIPALEVLDKAEISMALKLGIKMADKSIDPKVAFTSALPALAERAELDQYLEAIYELAIQLKERKIDPSNAIASACPALAKIAIDSKAFRNWSSRISRLNPKLFDICLKNMSIILDYFIRHSEADWNRFVLALDLYSKGHWGDMQLDEELVGHLCAPDLSISRGVEKARGYFNSRARLIAAEFGMKIDRFKHEDCIGLEALRGKIAGRKAVAIDRVLEKIAKYGNCYNYFKSEQPHFYRKFELETGALAEHFDTPGFKFSLNYRVSTKLKPRSFGDKMPISSDAAAVKEVIAELRARHERVYTHLYKLARDRGIKVNKALEDEVSGENLESMIKIMLKELQNSEIEERAKLVLRLIEACAFRETEEMRKKIASQADPVLKLNLLAEYWGHHVKAIARDGKLIGHKFYDRHIAPLLREKANVEKYLGAQLGRHDSGTLNFVLSERRISDLSKGDVSQDCLKDRLFIPGIAHIVDPAFFLFKIFEGEEWIGNVYTAICKDIEDKNVLLIDNMPIKTEHPILSGRKEDVDNFAKEFLEQIKSYAQRERFDYTVIAQDCSPRIRIKSALESALSRMPEKILLRKVADTLHFSEFGIETEFLQAFGKLEAKAKQWHEVSGYRY